MDMKKAFVSLLVLGLIILGLLSFWLLKKEKNEPPAFAVDGKTVWFHYKNNKIQADDNYFGPIGPNYYLMYSDKKYIYQCIFGQSDGCPGL